MLANLPNCMLLHQRFSLSSSSMAHKLVLPPVRQHAVMCLVLPQMQHTVLLRRARSSIVATFATLASLSVPILTVSPNTFPSV